MTTALLEEEPLPVGETLDLMGLVWAVDHALQAASQRMKAVLGVTGPQRLVIRIVGRFPGIPAGEVASVLHLHPSTISGVLNRLERRGLLERRQDPRDRRRVLLGLTARGRELDVDRRGTVESAVQAVLAGSAPGDVAATRTVLTRLARALESGIDALDRVQPNRRAAVT